MNNNAFVRKKEKKLFEYKLRTECILMRDDEKIYFCYVMVSIHYNWNNNKKNQHECITNVYKYYRISCRFDNNKKCIDKLNLKIISISNWQLNAAANYDKCN